MIVFYCDHPSKNLLRKSLKNGRKILKKNSTRKKHLNNNPLPFQTKKNMKKYFLILLLASFIFCLSSKANAYLLGFKSRDNSIENIQQIEEQYGMHLPIVSFIFDPRSDDAAKLISKLPSTL